MPGGNELEQFVEKFIGDFSSNMLERMDNVEARLTDHERNDLEWMARMEEEMRAMNVTMRQITSVVLEDTADRPSLKTMVERLDRHLKVMTEWGRAIKWVGGGTATVLLLVKYGYDVFLVATKILH